MNTSRASRIRSWWASVQAQHVYLIKITGAVILALTGIVGAKIAIVVWDRPQ